MSSTGNVPEIYFNIEAEDSLAKSRSESPENDLYEVVETGHEKDDAYDILDQDMEETTFTKTKKVTVKEKPSPKEPNKIARKRELVYLVLAVIFFVVVVAQAMALGYLLFPDRVPNPCNPNPFGLNTVSKIDGSNCISLCKPGFQGNPNSGCNKIECEINSNCSLGKICHDIDLCSIVNCSRNSVCKITNGFPTCQSVWLVGGSTNFEGNIFAYNSDTKIEGPVCDDNWDINDANVVCKELGFSGASRITSDSAYGAVPEDFSFDNVGCNGTESHLQNCPHSTSENCYGVEGAGVVCY